MGSLTGSLPELLASGGALGPGQLLLAMGIAYLGGVLASLTPCVYPMIPITVSVMGGLSHGGTTRAPWRTVATRGISYVAGMTVVYAFLGVLAGLTGKVFGTMTQTSGWHLGLGILFTVAALIMLDIIPFDPISWWERTKRRFGQKAHHPQTQATEMSYLGAFAIGISSGFLASPCTTPILTTILAYIANSKSVGVGLALMFSFAIGLGTLLLVIAFFAGAFQALPRSGGWMKKIKIASGILMLVFAEYLIYRAGSL